MAKAECIVASFISAINGGVRGEVFLKSNYKVQHFAVFFSFRAKAL